MKKMRDKNETYRFYISKKKQTEMTETSSQGAKAQSFA